MGIFGFGDKSKTSQKDAKKMQVDADKKTTDKKSESVKVTSKKTEVKKVSENTKAKVSVADLTGIIIKPRITEKSTILVEEGNVYTFDVHPEATKNQIAKAVQNHYKVKPIKVNIIDIKRKSVFRRGKKGKKGGGRKAMVYLRKGDKIEFV